ncbi:aspartate--tRNA ligase [Patescibacteria group bacterium]|nr:aspartate--tRNA ligase [Patescibacteria group bacterium]
MQRNLIKDTVKLTGKTILLKGWVNSIRSHGKITFFDLRDRTGLVQIVTQEKPDLKPESVISVAGKVVKRPEKLVNPKLATGTVEIQAEKIAVITQSKELPFPLDTDGHAIDESIRLKYRYLDLRRPRMNRIIKIRSQAVNFIRQFLLAQDFVEIETPILTKTTPEGARDFLVPSRLQPGKFYALPQSPQQYKQMLMVAGFERYFQIARCFRDEDPRHDRAYGEFTQLDLEMSFVEQNDILTLTETMFTQLVKTIFPTKKIKTSPWPRITHAEAQKKYGSDKPDLRKNKQDPHELAFAWIIDFPLFNKQTKADFFHGAGKNARFAPSHHMFTAPHPDDIKLLDQDPLKVRGLQHDLVLNGYEVGGGSIRIHDPKIQEKVFELIGFTDKQKQQFHHMLEAFTYGVPPHGGIAPGIDRLLMVLFNEPNLREVMAFPAIASGQTAVMEAPSSATPEQLQELHLSITDQPKISGKTVYEKIINLLKDNNFVYKTYTHEPVFTSEQAAKIRGTSLQQGAKALVMIADKKPIMVVLSGATKVDSKKFKTNFKIKDLRMATVKEVEEITGLKIGSIPPLGNIFEIKTFVDKKLGQNREITFNAASHTQSVKMSYKDFVNLVKPQIGAFVA